MACKPGGYAGRRLGNCGVKEGAHHGYYDELALLLAAEKIRDLKLQPEYTLQEAYTTLEGVRVRAIRYRADFSYERATEPDCCGEVHWLRVVEDVKSEATKTRVYAIKRKLMRERLGIDVREV